jgi:hypothetical protein
MIRIERQRDLAIINPKFTGAGLQLKLEALLGSYATLGADIAFTGNIGDWTKTKPQLKGESFNKCAYCESDTAVVAHGDVEHFRPKSQYWWLALCIDNYVFSCQLCNQTYKSDKFPIAGTKLKAPVDIKKIGKSKAAIKKHAPLLCPDPTTATDAVVEKLWRKEKADLIHPYLEDPEPLLAWKPVVTNKEIWLVPPPTASDRAKRAVKSAIENLGLNREELLRARYGYYFYLMDYLDQWSNAAATDKAGRAVFVTNFCDPIRPYSGMCRYFAREAGFPI